jgi:hypothetical protein
VHSFATPLQPLHTAIPSEEAVMSSNYATDSLSDVIAITASLEHRFCSSCIPLCVHSVATIASIDIGIPLSNRFRETETGA